jgi:hypothetical protein
LTVSPRPREVSLSLQCRPLILTSAGHGQMSRCRQDEGTDPACLAARAPYFHNGSAANLRDAIEFYDQRFNLNMTDRQKADLGGVLANALVGVPETEMRPAPAIVVQVKQEKENDQNGKQPPNYQA